MNLGGRWEHGSVNDDERTAATRAVQAALETGLTLFDHADIYTFGKSEAVFGDILRAQPGLRDRIVLQSKCGIRFAGDPQPGAPKRYDFSYEHIVRSTEASLRRLQTDWLDVLLLHRPDPLVQPEEVARAFDELHAAGKVRAFGVSNHTAAQIELLRHLVRQPLVVNQVELSLAHAHLIEEGISFNQGNTRSALAAGTLDYCRLNKILIQAWSPVGGGKLFNSGPAGLIHQLAREKATSPEAIVLAWLLCHPAGIQPVIGTLKPERIKASSQADAVELTREEWYSLFVAARGAEVP
jgi:predicted oxidoreductase